MSLRRDGTADSNILTQRKRPDLSLATYTRLKLTRSSRKSPRRLTHSRRLRREPNRSRIRIIAGEETREVRRLIHIDPQPVNINTRRRVEHNIKLVIPNLGDIWMELIWES